MSATFGLIAGTVFTMIGSFEKLQGKKEYTMTKDFF